MLFLKPYQIINHPLFKLFVLLLSYHYYKIDTVVAAETTKTILDLPPTEILLVTENETRTHTPFEISDSSFIGLGAIIITKNNSCKSLLLCQIVNTNKNIRNIPSLTIIIT